MSPRAEFVISGGLSQLREVPLIWIKALDPLLSPILSFGQTTRHARRASMTMIYLDPIGGSFMGFAAS